jgi:hypothetical protein
MAAKRKKTKLVTFILPKLVVEVRPVRGKGSSRSRTVGPFKLVKERNSFNCEEITWKLYAKSGTRYHIIGAFNVMAIMSNNKPTAAISGAEIDIDSFKGLGLAKRAYRLLANFYGGLESDPNGNTSNDAKRVWKSLKAKSISSKRFRIEAEKKK